MGMTLLDINLDVLSMWDAIGTLLLMAVVPLLVGKRAVRILGKMSVRSCRLFSMNAIPFVPDLDEVSARRLKLLTTVADAEARQPGERIPLKGKLSYPEIDGDVKALKDDGLLSGVPVLQGFWSVTVTPKGEQFLAKIRKVQADVVERRKFTRTRLARWMLVQSSQLELLQLDDFLAGSPSFYGDSLSENDVNEAAAWLRESGYLAPNPVVAWGGVFIMARLSPTGQLWSEIGEVSQGAPPMYPTTVNVDNSVHVKNSNVALNSPNAHQTIGITEETLEALRQFVQEVQRELPELGIPEDDKAELSTALESITAEMESPNPKPSRIKGLIGQIGVFLSNTGSSALGGYLQPQIPVLLALLSQSMGMG